MWFFNCKKFPLSQGFDLLSMCVFESFRECYLGLNFVKFVLGYVGIYNKCYLNYAIQGITFVVHTWTESIYSTLTLGTGASDSTLVLINLHAKTCSLHFPHGLYGTHQMTAHKVKFHKINAYHHQQTISVLFPKWTQSQEPHTNSCQHQYTAFPFFNQR